MDDPSRGYGHAMIHSMMPAAGEYALRAVVCLAANPPLEWTTARDLAEMANIPPAFLAKVLRKLVQNGVLEAQKGHNGGFRLAGPAASFRVMDVLKAAEIDFEPGHCAFGFDRCNEQLPCPLHDVYRDLQRMCQMWAKANTLADIDASRIPRTKPSQEKP